jgi:hypothetical protein
MLLMSAQGTDGCQLRHKYREAMSRYRNIPNILFVGNERELGSLSATYLASPYIYTNYDILVQNAILFLTLASIHIPSPLLLDLINQSRRTQYIYCRSCQCLPYSHCSIECLFSSR